MLSSRLKFLLPSLLFIVHQSYGAMWSVTDVSFLSGNGYKSPGAPPEEKSYNILTLEHVSAWKYGDNFFFTDVSDFNSSKTSIYAEWAPRLSAGKILDKKIGYGPILDVLLSAQYGFASGGAMVEMLGVGVDLAIPGFKFFNANLYSRDDRKVEGTSYQITLAWGADFNLGIPLRFIGFLDYASEEGSGSNKSEANLLAQPQLLWMAHKNLGIGIEYQYWQNKYGIDGLDESLPQFILRWTL